jgi:hypothetical protein
MIWDLKTTQAILGMRTVFRVEVDALRAGGEEYVKFLAGKCYREIQEMAYSYAAELNIEDMVYRWDVDELPGTQERVHTLRTRWEPATNTVLMHGGEMDGQVFGVDRDALRRFPIRVAKSVDSGKLWGTTGDDPLPPVADPDSVLSYEWSGWEDSRGLWVYSLNEGR